MNPNNEHQLSVIIQTKYPSRSENKCKTGDHIALCKHCNLACIFCSLGPGSTLGENEKKSRCREKKSASEVSPAVVWGGKRWRWRRPSPFSSSPIDSLRYILADIYFFYFPPCFAFSLTSEPGPRLNFCWNCKLWIFSGTNLPRKTGFLT